MAETREPSPSRETTPFSDEEEESLLILQIQAFLEASEDVDIDKETVEDLMGVLSEYQDKGDSGTTEPLTSNLTNQPSTEGKCSIARTSVSVTYTLPLHRRRARVDKTGS